MLIEATSVNSKSSKQVNKEKEADGHQSGKGRLMEYHGVDSTVLLE